MSSTFVLLFVIFGQVLMLLLLSLNGAEARSIFEIGQRQDGDHLVLRDSRSSRPASTSEPPKVSFTYNLTEPITYIEFSTEEVSLSSPCSIFAYSETPKIETKICFFRHRREQKIKTKTNPHRQTDIHTKIYIFIYLYLVHVFGVLSVSFFLVISCADY